MQKQVTWTTFSLLTFNLAIGQKSCHLSFDLDFWIDYI